MATGEDEAETIILNAFFILLMHLSRQQPIEDVAVRRLELLGLAEPVDSFEPSRGDQPRAWIRGNSLLSPLLHCCHECVVQSLLGQIEIAEEADEGREHTARFRSVDRIDLVAHVRRNVFLHSLWRRTARRWRARQSAAPRSSRTSPMESATPPELRRSDPLLRSGSSRRAVPSSRRRGRRLWKPFRCVCARLWPRSWVGAGWLRRTGRSA